MGLSDLRGVLQQNVRRNGCINPRNNPRVPPDKLRIVTKYLDFGSNLEIEAAFAPKRHPKYASQIRTLSTLFVVYW